MVARRATARVGQVVKVTEEMQASVNGVVLAISEELARLAPALPYMDGGAEAARLRRTLLNSREHFLCALASAEAFVLKHREG
jgi:hypothetical protein